MAAVINRNKYHIFKGDPLLVADPSSCFHIAWSVQLLNLDTTFSQLR